MKYNKKSKGAEKRKVASLHNETVEKQANEKVMPEMTAAEEPARLAITGEPVGDLQAQVYSAGKRLLSVLKEEKLLESNAEDEETDKQAKAEAAVNELGRFTYNVGFAGEQSCGKSTVINSTVQYPIMPTCKLTTTAAVVQMVYSEHTRVRAFDDDTGKVVLDFDCVAPAVSSEKTRFNEQFRMLLEYGVEAMKVLVIENFQYFSKVNVRDSDLTVDDIDMSSDDPKHVLLLMLILLAVYVGQNDASWDENTSVLMAKREKLFHYFGIPENTINLSVKCQCDFEVLKSGLMITDLPGLGSNAQQQERNGRKVKSHDDITKEAISMTETMVFITTPENRKEGYQVLPEMLSNARLNEVVKKGDRILPLLNKIDACGDKEREAAISSFLRALKTAGVEKSEEDIVPYSALYGEYGFGNIPFERTLYYMDNYSEREVQRMIRRGLAPDEAQQEYIQDLREDLRAEYDKSGVEKLQSFFCSRFVETGKYNKSIAVIQTLRGLIRENVLAIRSALKSIEAIGKASVDVKRNLIIEMERAVIQPIANVITLKGREIGMIQKLLMKEVEIELKQTPEAYMSALRTALEAYKTKLINTINGFDLTFGGLGSKARIDQSGSANRSRYLRLKTEINDFPVSLVDVNNGYIAAMKMISDELDGFYDDAVDQMKDLKKEIERSLDKAVEQLKADGGDAAMLQTLRTQLISFADAQIKAIMANKSDQNNQVTQAQNEIVQAIFDLNAEMVSQYSTFVKNDLNNCIDSGFFMTSREYLMVDGSNGIRDAVKKLSLNGSDGDNIRQNIDAGVNALLRNQVPGWTNDLFNALTIYRDLRNQIKKLMNGIKDAADQSAGDIEKRCGELRARLVKWEDAARGFKAVVQGGTADAFDYMHDQEPSNAVLRQDVLNGCLE